MAVFRLIQANLVTFRASLRSSLSKLGSATCQPAGTEQHLTGAHSPCKVWSASSVQVKVGLSDGITTEPIQKFKMVMNREQ